MSTVDFSRSKEQLDKEIGTKQEKVAVYELIKDIYPKDDKVAEKRFQAFSSKDPYPQIAPALLNSADILKYVISTGMIYPFDYSKLEGASYDVKLAGKVVYWDEKGNKIVKNIVKNPIKEDEVQDFILQKNSIAFVTLEPIFRIPDYIALRFNLKISHIYKGLLLGTGPLVDPGFVGRLSIPLHNLTANNYRFEFGQGMIQLEFTKLSDAEEFKATEKELDKEYIIKETCRYIRNNIPPQRDVEQYIKKAVSQAVVGGNGDSIVKSAIPETIENIEAVSEDLKKQVQSGINEAKSIKEEYESFEAKIQEENEKATNLNKISIFAVAAMIITIITLSFNTLKTLEDANQRNAQEVTVLTEDFEKLSDKYKDLLDKYTKLEKDYNELKDTNNKNQNDTVKNR